MHDYRTFVVPYDFSPHAREALHVATDLARRLSADVHLVHVVQLPAYASGFALYGGVAAPSPVAVPPIDLRDVRESAMKSLREVADGIPSLRGSVELHVVEGPGVAEMIGEVAESLGADLIVMGTHGRTGLAHVFLGSVAERTLRRAPCPVLTVQAPGDAGDR